MTQIADHVAEFKAMAENLPATRRFSDADLETLYAIAYASYQQGRYARAASHFGQLTVYRPTSARFLKGQAASQFMARMYQEAAATYAFTLLLHPTDVEALCMYAHSLLLTGRKEAAVDALHRALAVEGGAVEFRNRAKALLELVAA
jgi:predicted Zn-dependent protease